MGESGLHTAIRNRKPLVEVVIQFAEGIDCDSTTAKLNALADDFHLDHRPYMGKARLRIGSATKDALDRLFGWKLKRVPIGNLNSCGGTNSYKWAEESPVCRHPIEGIHSIVMTQPGADDEGQWHE